MECVVCSKHAKRACELHEHVAHSDNVQQRIYTSNFKCTYNCKQCSGHCLRTSNHIKTQQMIERERNCNKYVTKSTQITRVGCQRINRFFGSIPVNWTDLCEHSQSTYHCWTHWILFKNCQRRKKVLVLPRQILKRHANCVTELHMFTICLWANPCISDGHMKLKLVF